MVPYLLWNISKQEIQISKTIEVYSGIAIMCFINVTLNINFPFYIHT